MKTKYLIISLIALAAIVAIITNPSPERHKEVVRNKIHQYLQKPMIEGLENARTRQEDVVQALDLLLVNTVADKLIDNLVTSSNYLLFSTTQISVEGKSKTIGYGLFGNVILAKELDSAMNVAINNTSKSEEVNKKSNTSK